MSIWSLVKKASKYKVERECKRIFKVSSGKRVYRVFLKDGELLCDCMHSSLHPNKLCSHKIAVLFWIEEEVRCVHG